MMTVYQKGIFPIAIKQGFDQTRKFQLLASYSYLATSYLKYRISEHWKNKFHLFFPWGGIIVEEHTLSHQKDDLEVCKVSCS